jgi:hypothetical protein
VPLQLPQLLEPYFSDRVIYKKAVDIPVVPVDAVTTRFIIPDVKISIMGRRLIAIVWKPSHEIAVQKQRHVCRTLDILDVPPAERTPAFPFALGKPRILAVAAVTLRIILIELVMQKVYRSSPVPGHKCANDPIQPRLGRGGTQTYVSLLKYGFITAIHICSTSGLNSLNLPSLSSKYIEKTKLHWCRFA